MKTIAIAEDLKRDTEQLVSDAARVPDAISNDVVELKKKLPKKLSLWQMALLSVGASLLGGLSAMMSKRKQRKIYKNQTKQAPWAPPAWAFSPAWTFNNFFLIMALKRILSTDMPRKKRLLLLQAGIWTIFFSFNYINFRKRSTVLAAAWTQADAVLALSSMLAAWKADKKVSLNYLPLVIWTWYASTVAHYQALNNPDYFLKTPAPLRR